MTGGIGLGEVTFVTGFSLPFFDPFSPSIVSSSIMAPAGWAGGFGATTMANWGYDSAGDPSALS